MSNDLRAPHHHYCSSCHFSTPTFFFFLFFFASPGWPIAHQPSPDAHKLLPVRHGHHDVLLRSHQGPAGKSTAKQRGLLPWEGTTTVTAHTASEGCALAAGCNCKSHSFCCRWRCQRVSKQESQSCVRTVTWTYGRERGKKKKNQLPIEPWEYNKGHARSVNALLSQCWVSPTKDIQVPVSSRVNIGRTPSS